MVIKFLMLRAQTISNMPPPLSTRAPPPFSGAGNQTQGAIKMPPTEAGDK